MKNLKENTDLQQMKQILMMTTGFWLSFLFICCLYPLQTYKPLCSKANSKIPVSSGSEVGQCKCRAESINPQLQRPTSHRPQ